MSTASFSPPNLPLGYSDLMNPSLITTPVMQKATEPAPDLLPAATKTEKFLLTAADQESGSRDERLNRVIRSKYEAGLLKVTSVFSSRG
jgi:hypothetical protein